MTEVVSVRLPEELRKQLADKCSVLGCNINDYLKETIELKLHESKIAHASTNFDILFKHMKTCSRCLSKLIERGYVMISLDELKKFGLELDRKQV